MKKIILIAAAAFMMQIVQVSAQGKFFTRNGKVTFYSQAPMEEIDGINSKVTSIIDTQTGQLEIAIQMKAFEFEKALMQEHFNENYAESDKFPKSIFKGAFENPENIKWTVDGIYPVKVVGKMTMHGVTRDLTTDGTVEIKAGKINTKSTFNLLIKDYDIQIPKLVKDKVAESIKVVVDMNFDPYPSN